MYKQTFNMLSILIVIMLLCNESNSIFVESYYLKAKNTYSLCDFFPAINQAKCANVYGDKEIVYNNVNTITMCQDSYCIKFLDNTTKCSGFVWSYGSKLYWSFTLPTKDVDIKDLKRFDVPNMTPFTFSHNNLTFVQDVPLDEMVCTTSCMNIFGFPEDGGHDCRLISFIRWNLTSIFTTGFITTFALYAFFRLFKGGFMVTLMSPFLTFILVVMFPYDTSYMYYLYGMLTSSVVLFVYNIHKDYEHDDSSDSDSEYDSDEDLTTSFLQSSAFSKNGNPQDGYIYEV